MNTHVTLHGLCFPSEESFEILVTSGRISSGKGIDTEKNNSKSCGPTGEGTLLSSALLGGHIFLQRLVCMGRATRAPKSGIVAWHIAGTELRGCLLQDAMSP